MPFPLLLSNVVFDGLTLVATFAVLAWAMRGKRPTGVPLRRILVAVAADVMTAAIFACCSLYIGLRFTDSPVTLVETLNVLRFRSASGDAWELGPHFWAMHTTFLPTLAYLSLILGCCVAKAMLLPARWVFGWHTHSSPLKLTALVLTVFAALFLALSQGAKFGQEYATRQEAASEAPTR